MLFGLALLQLYSGDEEAVQVLQVLPSLFVTNDRNWSRVMR